MIGRLAIRAYLAAGRLAEPVAGSILGRRVRRGKEDSTRLPERFGIAGLDRPPGRLVWIHAASVGETNAVLPLVDHLRAHANVVLLTTGTTTSAEFAARRLPEGCVHQYVPLDMPRFLDRFLDHWAPELAIFAESEIWPAAIDRLSRRDIPLVLVNGRMSDRSFRGWCRSGPVGRAVMGRIGICIAQSEDDARRFSDLGVPTVATSGNLKFDVPAPRVDDGDLSDWQDRAGSRPVLVAGSTHDGEEALVADAHRRLQESFPDLLTIIAPRHPDRGEALARAIAGQGFAVARRSLRDDLTGDVELYIGDTVGEMGLWYRLASIVIMGGSFVPHGGQNPIEPAKLGKPIIHGPHTANFRDVYSALHNAGAAVEVDNVDELTEKLAALLSDGDLRKKQGERARDYVNAQAGALERTIAFMSAFLGGIGCGEIFDGQGS